MERLQGAPIPETSPQAATPFGKYLLIKRLAVGGMAELFLAQEPPRSELVVIKRILPYLSEEPEFVQMFLDEARIAAQLHHPNVVQVFELGRINESIFIAMEYVEGVDLRRIVAEEAKFSSQVPYAVAARICAQVASGLDHAHNSKGVDGRPLGLIHRDVSPQNVMVAYDGSVKLVDFGIAKAEALAERSKPGVIKGKFLYLSPEQVMQEKLDSRSDIFALGVMLYEITTGRSPFARPTTEAILYAIRFEMPSPPHLIRDDYPQELSRIVMKCLTKDRNQRYQRASQVQADLEALLASGTMRGSDDVSEYIARLLGAAEERTMLHVPIPASKKGATPAPQPAGLSARPARRNSAENLPLAGDPDDVEFATEMARPRDMLAAAAPADPSPTGPIPLGDEEEDEATAISTLPGRNSGPLAPPVPSRALPRLPTGESTVQERPSRAAAMTPARPLAARKSPLSSPSVASLDRRRGPPVHLDEQDEQDDEASQSVSLTPATVNNRAPVRAAYLSREDDSQVEDSRGDTQSEVSDLLELSTQPQRVARMDPDDDESTAGYGGHTQTQTETQSRPERRRSRTGVLLVAVVTLVLVIAAAAAWLFLLDPARPGASEAPVGEAAAVEETPPAATADNPPPTEPPAATGETPPSEPASATATGTASPGQEQGSAAPTSTPPTATAPTPGTEQGSAVAPVVAEPPSATGVATQGPDTGTPSPTSVKPSEVSVLFKAPARTSLKVVGGRSVKPNDSLMLAPGTVRIEYRCPGSRSPKLRKSFQVPENPKEPVVFRVECAPRRRR